MMKGFDEPEKYRKKTQNFDTRFWEHDQSVEMNAQGPFLFFQNYEKVKNELLDRHYCLFLPLQDLKNDN